MYILYIKDLQYFLKIMTNVDENYKTQATQPISIANTNTNSDAFSELNGTHFHRFIFITILIIVSILICPILLFVIGYYAYSTASIFTSLSCWIMYGASRAPLIIECLIHVFLGFCLRDSVIFSTKSEQFELATNTSNIYFQILDFLDKGNNDVLPLRGYDEEYDNFVLTESCNLDYNEKDLHMQYRCASLESAYYMVISLVDIIVKSDEAPSSSDLNKTLFLNLFHLINSHVLIRSRKASDIINHVSEKQISSYQNLLIIILIIAIIISIIVFILMLYIPFLYDDAYSVAKSLLRKLPPEAVINNINLHNYILFQISSSTHFMSLGEKIIHESLSPILIVGRSQHIESANSAVSQTLGFRPEELIGQPFSSIICEEDQENVNRLLTLMRLGESGDFCQETINCVTDANELVPTSMTILGMRKSAQAELNSYVILLRDETILQSQQLEVEEAKRKSEALLYEILPRDIVVLINKGEKNVNFSLEIATIMFIDIDKFSEFSKLLLPAQILGSLSTIFGAFDTLLKNYPTLSKIKTIGDIYMCAAGLFHPNDPPQNATMEAVQFGFDCLQAIEDINHNCNSNLSIRIGINTGGPIIAGILGTDKPAFDIIGDPINIAARLQSTDIPGQIHISVSTFNLLEERKFNYQKREVILKGKGKTTAYLINPLSSSQLLK